jgi:hypothetical protein
MRVAHGEEQILVRLRLILNQLGLPFLSHQFHCPYPLQLNQFCG